MHVCKVEEVVHVPLSGGGVAGAVGERLPVAAVQRPAGLGARHHAVGSAKLSQSKVKDGWNLRLTETRGKTPTLAIVYCVPQGVQFNRHLLCRVGVRG